jgi:hypothetical protein
MSRKTQQRIDKAMERIEAFTEKKHSDHHAYIDHRTGFKVKPIPYLIRFIYAPKRAS